MAEPTRNLKQYRIENLSCASCAQKIETAVGKMPGVRFVHLNFAAASLELDADDTKAVFDRIQEIEPQVQLQVETEGNLEVDPLRRKLILIGSAAVLFIIGLGLASRLEWPPFSSGSLLIFGAAYLISGHQVIWRAVQNIRAGSWFDETFLMTVATIGAIAIGEFPEAVGVMLFYQVGEYLQHRSVSRSRKMIEALMDLHPDHAVVVHPDGRQEQVPPEQIKVGQQVHVRPGEKFPLDGVVLDGASLVDISLLTGESVPVAVSPGSEVFAGALNQTGVLQVQVSKPLAESSVSRMLALVQNAASRKAATERFITRFARWYSPAMVILALGVALIPPLILPGQAFDQWFYRALVLLVISCPCALLVSIPLGYFGGIGGASRRGILIKGANFLDVLADLRVVVFDKTGTITQGSFRVTEVVPELGIPRGELFTIAATAELYSSHPLAEAIRKAYREEGLGDLVVRPEIVEEYQEDAGFGIKARVNGSAILLGNDAILHREGIPHTTCDVPGTVVHVSRDGSYLGYLVVEDQIKPGVSDAVAALRKLGITRLSMLSGDQEDVASRVAAAAGLDDFRAGLLPEEKVASLEEILSEEGGAKVAFVGDGINDAPALARADVGIAMGALGTDAARETADVVLMRDSIAQIAEAVTIGRRTRRIVWQNIILALGAKFIFILLGIAGSASMWEAVFADVGITVLAVVNASRVMQIRSGYE
ncbi:MAG: cadmium-translocating P-type ATPase [Anaerolineales bacterium]|nr:cadmium-translocating P-type ATPase [Anaerolineales bacterium]